MLLIYSETLTARLKYAAQLVLGDIYGIEPSFTIYKDEFLSREGPKINYSGQDLGEGLQIIPSTLLFEKPVLEKKVEVGSAGDTVTLFPSVTGDFPFDVFSAAFYMVTRYEEYITSKKDRFGRFQASSGIAAANGFNEIPVVNLWARMLVDALMEKYPSLVPAPPGYRFVSTIDVDHAYAYRNRTFLRTLGGAARNVSRGEFRKLAERFMVLSGLRPDPYDTFRYLLDCHRRSGITPAFFILLADYGKHDNNVSIHKPEFRNLLACLADETMVGIHPSLSSNRHPELLTSEIHGLAAVTGRAITASRQHFLKFSFPKTFRQLVTNGILDDYSMGYATSTGFRAGIASPFKFFDLYRNEATGLTIHPVSAMDVTFRDYLQLSPDESTRRIKQLADLVRSYHGEFVSIWHNESLSDTGRWKGWRKVFEETTAYAAEGSR